MTRVPISLYLNIVAGIFVLFGHYASSETGDTALNKVTGAAGRFYTLFQDTILTFQHGCASRLEMVLCGPVVDNVFPHEAAEYIKVRYCPSPAQEPESSYGASRDDRQPHGGYGSSGIAFGYYRPPMRSPVPRTAAEDPVGRSLWSSCWLYPVYVSQTVWDWTREVVGTIGGLLVHMYALWWCFRAPLKVTGVLFVSCAALSVLGYLLDTSIALEPVS